MGIGPNLININKYNYNKINITINIKFIIDKLL